jgi:hypothetical protein
VAAATAAAGRHVRDARKMLLSLFDAAAPPMQAGDEGQVKRNAHSRG